jgi:hypothetical protein
MFPAENNRWLDVIDGLIHTREIMIWMINKETHNCEYSSAWWIAVDGLDRAIDHLDNEVFERNNPTELIHEFLAYAKNRYLTNRETVMTIQPFELTSQARGRCAIRRPEQEIQRSVFEHFAWRAMPGVFAFHCPNGGWRSPVEAQIFKSLGVVAGVPDILIVCRGKLYALELKATRGQLTKVQIETQARMRAAGVVVETAHGIDQAIQALETWGMLKPNRAMQTGSM